MITKFTEVRIERAEPCKSEKDPQVLFTCFGLSNRFDWFLFKLLSEKFLPEPREFQLRIATGTLCLDQSLDRRWWSTVLVTTTLIALLDNYPVCSNYVLIRKILLFWLFKLFKWVPGPSSDVRDPAGLKSLKIVCVLKQLKVHLKSFSALPVPGSRLRFVRRKWSKWQSLFAATQLISIEQYPTDQLPVELNCVSLIIANKLSEINGEIVLQLNSNEVSEAIRVSSCA